MELHQLVQKSEMEWWIEPTGKMRVPGVIYADSHLIQKMDQKVYEQVVNVATLPGIQKASYAMPDAHWGYGFPIGGVAAFDPNEGGVISAGGVGFDISCGVRSLYTGLPLEAILPVQEKLADELFLKIPAGVGSVGKFHLDSKEMDQMLVGGAQWSVSRGYGTRDDLECIEERGSVKGAQPERVSDYAKKRQKDQMGTLGSGNHYLEVQCVEEVFDKELASTFGIGEGEILISIHCGSRGLGHQVGTDYLRKMALSAQDNGIFLPERELACAPIRSRVGQEYLGAMNAAMNCALANRQIITHLVREVFERIFPGVPLQLLYDVSHNTCKNEEYLIHGKPKKVFVHRKGATRAFGPGHPDLPLKFQKSGQPVLIGGTMGTASYILVGTAQAMDLSFGSACHGAGRTMSRHQAKKQWTGREVIDQLARKGIMIRSGSHRGVAEEAPGSYKDVHAVVEVAEVSGLSRKVARLRPLICVKG